MFETVDPETGEPYSDVDVDAVIEHGRQVEKQVLRYDTPKERGEGLLLREKEVEKRLRKEEASQERLLREFDSLPESERARRADEYGAKLDAGMARITALNTELNALRDDPRHAWAVHYGLHRALGSHQGGISREFGPDFPQGLPREVADSGWSWFTRRVGSANLPKKNAVVEFHPTSESRSFCVGREVHLSYGASSSVVVHELGHWLEHNRDDVRTAAIRFLERRFKQTSTPGDIKKLSDLTGSSTYAPTEVAFRDRFADPYVGKLYTGLASFPGASGGVGGRITATEVVSMGIQMLYQNPGRFKSTDPQHYYFTLGVMRLAAKHRNPAQTAAGAAPFRIHASELGTIAEELKGRSRG